MTAIGKLLVFLNVFLGLGLFSWGLSAYSNRVDWLDRKGETPTEGQITTTKKRIEQLTRAIAEAQTGPVGYGTRRAQLQVVEGRRDDRQRGFARRIEQARNGRFRVQLTLDGTPAAPGLITNLDAEGPEVIESQRPLEGLQTLQNRFTAETRAIELLQTGKGIQQPAAWQNIVGGTTNLEQVATLVPDLGIGDLRRLHTELSALIKLDETSIAKQQFVQSNLRDEQAYLGAKRVSWVAELITLEARQKQLEDRLQSFQTPKAQR